MPIGTIEWHGNHLPIETDFLIAQKLCEILAGQKKGYVLPPIFLGTDKTRIRGGKKFIGMNSYFKKELKGSLYYLKPGLLYQIVQSAVNNLTKQGFRKIYIITGHGGSKHVEILKKIEKDNKNVYFINPWEKVRAHHADEFETSLFWACYPDEIKKSAKIKISADDDFIKYAGYDPGRKAYLAVGKKMLREIIKNALDKIS